MDADKNISFDHQKYASKRCAPIFIEKKFYNQAIHDESTPSATATFIKYKDRFFVVTCKHVVDLLVRSIEEERIPYTLRLNFNSIDVDFSNLVFNCSNTPLWCPTFDIVKERDIAIAEVNMDLFFHIAKSKDKTYIDLDNHIEPSPTEGQCLCAYGWLCDTKYCDGNDLVTKMASVVIELRSLQKELDNEITLFSTMKDALPPLSGMSGGPIYCEIDEQQISPIGIVYEGQPGSIFTEKQEAGFFSENDALIKGYYLSPTIFQHWLDDIKPAWKAYPLYEKYTPQPAMTIPEINSERWKENCVANLVVKL